MTEEIIYKTLKAQVKDDGEQGQVSAVIATFGVVDADGDIIEPGTFTAGQQVPMAWAHDWTKLIGKGEIQTTQTAAIFNGAFFLETEAGQEAYKTVRAMGDLQEWSWGFRVLDASYELRDDGDYIRIIKRADVYEVSPVLRGAGVGTYTLDLKGMTFDEHEKAVLTAIRSYGDRVRALAGLREKEGRTVGDRRLAGLKAVLSELQEIQNLLEKQAQPEIDVRKQYNQFLKFEARLNGVLED